MKQNMKFIIGFAVALTAIGVVCVVALRYMDVLLKPVNAMRDAIKGFRNGGEDCDFNCDDCDEQAF